MKEIRKSLGRIEGQLDLLVPVIQDHGNRLRTVEKRQSWFTGVLTTAAFIWTGLIGWIKWG